MSRCLLIISFIVSGLVGFAQQVPFYNHNIINPFIFNPAMAGASGDVNAFLVRNQRYNAFGGSSVNNYLTIDGAFTRDKKEISNAGFGLQVSHQVRGIQQQLASSLTYAYKLKINDHHDVRLGLSAGLLDNRIDFNSINVQQTDDPYLLALRPNATTFDINAGLSYRWNALRIGFSVPQIAGNKVSYTKDAGRGFYRLARHMMMTAEYDFPLTKNIILKPYVLARYVPGAPLQYDVMAHFDHTGLGWISVGYKSDYSIQANIGFRILENFKVGYSYEYLIGSMKNYSTGAHNELMLAFMFRPKRKTITNTVVEIKEVKVEVPVKDEEAEKENEELRKRNEELEELLRQTQAEKEELAEENRKLKEELDRLRQQAVVVPKDTVRKKEPEEIPVASGYHFIELNQTDSPVWYYVIAGVFSTKKNADNVLRRNLDTFPDAYLVINKSTNFYYVILHYTKDKDDAKNASKRYDRGDNGEDAWILNYKL